MTWNVDWGAPKPELVPRTVLEEGPDIVCLQETTPEWERFLRPRLSHRYPHIEFRHSPGAGGQAFLSMFPFRELSYDPSPVGWFPAWSSEISVLAGGLLITRRGQVIAVLEDGSVVCFGGP